MKPFYTLISIIFVFIYSAFSSAQGSITGVSDPCLDSRERYSYCPGVNYPYHWRWSVTGDATVTDLGTTSSCYLAEVKVGKRTTTLTFHQSNPVGVPQVQNVTKYISPKKCDKSKTLIPDQTKPVAEVKVNWTEYNVGGKNPNQQLLDQLYSKRQELMENKSLNLNSSAKLENCSYVYWGCGSCPSGGARVDAYCGNGGSQPDYSWCESC